MLSLSVQILHDAEQDLLQLYWYIAHHDSDAKAGILLEKIEDLCLSLEQFPMRGHVLPELQFIAVASHREIHFKPYRIIY